MRVYENGDSWALGTDDDGIFHMAFTNMETKKKSYFINYIKIKDWFPTAPLPTIDGSSLFLDEMVYRKCCHGKFLADGIYQLSDNVTLKTANSGKIISQDGSEFLYIGEKTFLRIN